MVVMLPLLSALLVAGPSQTAPLPVAPPPHAATDPELVKHLAAWRAETAKRSNVRAVLDVTLTEVVLKRQKRYGGAVLWMRPNYLVMRLDNQDDQTRADYEAFVCDGEAVYEYDGLAKTVTERRLVPDATVGPLAPEGFFIECLRRWLARAANVGEHVAMKCLTGLDAEGDRDRYRITLVRAGQNAIEFDIEPLFAEELGQFAKARLKLTGPDAKVPYCAVGVRVTRHSGDTEVWKFTELQSNIPGLAANHFQHQKPPGFTFSTATHSFVVPNRKK
jgi:TIGR03009 family protein